MKYLILPLFGLLFTAGLAAQTVDNQNQKLIEAFVKSKIDLQAEPVNPADVSKIFTGNFFKIDVGFIESGSGSSSCGEADYVNINGTEVKMIESIHMDVDCPILQSLLKKDFLLKDDNAANQFEAALDVLYPVDKKEIPNIKHFLKGTQWIFLRGKFFDDFTAFIVSTGTNGMITKIEVKLAYPVND